MHNNIIPISFSKLSCRASTARSKRHCTPLRSRPDSARTQSGQSEMFWGLRDCRASSPSLNQVRCTSCAAGANRLRARAPRCERMSASVQRRLFRPSDVPCATSKVVIAARPSAISTVAPSHVIDVIRSPATSPARQQSECTSTVPTVAPS